MRRYTISGLIVLAILAAFTRGLPAQKADQSDADKKQIAAPSQDLSGVWAIRTPRGIPWYNYALTADTPPMTPWAEAQFKNNKPSFGPTQFESPNDLAYGCFPPGVPRIYAAVQASMQIAQVPGRVIMFSGRNVRQIYTDGRKHPQDAHPLWMGHSIGQWEGETFVIDTVSVSDRTWLDRMGHPHSDALHLVERFQRTAYDKLDLELTIDDPKAYTKSWTAQRTFQLRPSTGRVDEAICEDMFVNEAFGVNPILPSRQ
jgi:hypothetical protein